MGAGRRGRKNKKDGQGKTGKAAAKETNQTPPPSTWGIGKTITKKYRGSQKI